ncbi:MAG: hypothetical protein M1819_000386 [Sarea resinae]|nr:MAG: hypothetical protein M1819_000386 [Sarea resinae]
MTDYIRVYTERGQLYYIPESLARHRADVPPCLFQARRRRPHSIHVTRIYGDNGLSKGRPASYRPHFRKLAGSRDNVKRFLRSFTYLPSNSSTRSNSPTRRPSVISLPPTEEEESAEAPPTEAPPPDMARPAARNSIVGGPISGMVSRPALAESVRTASERSTSTSSDIASVAPQIASEKPIASGNGIAVSISLAEPVLFLQGFEQNDVHSGKTAMLRGSLHLRVAKTAKIKAVTLNFRGKAITKWPEGIPPRKVDFEEVETIMNHTWPFFNAQFPTAEAGHCADVMHALKGPTTSTTSIGVSSIGSAFDQFARSASPISGLSGREHKRLSLQLNPSRSFGKDDLPPSGPTVAQRGYRTFHPGDYIYNFELPLDSRLPETINVELGTVKYELEALVERSGAFRANLIGTKEVTLIRAPSESSLEQVEPIAISRNWEDQLHYDIVISGKSFPLGTQIPIAFKLTPLAKVQCHRIKVFVTENIEYFCHNKRVHRMEPTRKVLLFEKRADGPSTSTYPGSSIRITAGGGVDYDSRESAARGEEYINPGCTNLLGNLDGEYNVGPTEMEFNVQLPSCSDVKDKDKGQKLHWDTTFQNIQVHHWIKIVMRLSKPDPNDSSKRRHFEISIDSPFHILSCRATQANTSLPAYTSPQAAHPTADTHVCGCPGAARRRASNPYVTAIQHLSDGRNSVDQSRASPGLARPQPAHLSDPSGTGGVQRPMHMIRNPSFNPPAFDSEDPPPPLVTPPPQYDSIVGEGQGLADYFARLADENVGDEDDGSDGDGDASPRTARRGRVNLPLTPGGRVNRSMDERRTWVPIGHTAT